MNGFYSANNISRMGHHEKIINSDFFSHIKKGRTPLKNTHTETIKRLGQLDKLAVWITEHAESGVR